jgi:putative nucleotidyltransferase with HDIG domain
MRLSDLLAKSGSSLGKIPPASSENTSPSIISPKPPVTSERPSTTPSTPKTPPPRPARITQVQNTSLYDSLPSAIYQAAEQLEIPIPQNRQLVLKNAKVSLLNLFNSAVDPSSPKDKLWEMTRNIVADLSMLLALDSNLAKLLERDNTTEGKIISHSINTALIAMDLAKEVKRIEFTVQEIGAAAILHDIGIIALRLDFDNGEKEPSYTQHVSRGVEILEELKVPESVKVMVSQHHERIDGQGYPKGIAGKDFLISSQILALSETFERIMTESFEEKGTDEPPQQNYVQATLDNFHKALDPEILKTFISIRGFYPNGIMIELTNRSICLVIRQNEGFPLRPVVQVVLDSAGNHPDTARIIDLRSNNTLSIIKAITYNGEQT